MQLTVSNDDQYFVFEDVIFQVMLCFSRDTEVGQMSVYRRCWKMSKRETCLHSSDLPQYPCWSIAWLGKWHPQIQSIDRRLKRLTARPEIIIQYCRYSMLITAYYILCHVKKMKYSYPLNRIWTFMMSLSNMISVVITWKNTSFH